MNIKHLIAILLCFAMLFGAMGALTSCGGETPETPDNGTTPPDDTDGGDEDEGVNYTVTVKDYNGNAINNVKVVFVSGDYTSSEATTDANGKATASVKVNGDVKVSFVNLEGYGEPSAKNSTFAKNKTELEVTLNPSITVKVVDENGNPIKDVSVMICHNVCLTPAKTDANGVVARSFAPKDAIKVSIQSVPDGYVIPEAVTSIEGTDYHVVLDEGVFTTTVVLSSAN